MESEELQHIGIRRRSGRYPWGSGNNPYQRSKDFKAYYEDLKSQGFKDTDIAAMINEISMAKGGGKFTTTDLRAAISISTEEIRNDNIARAQYLKDHRQMSNVKIAKEMGTGEATVRGWLKDSEKMKANSVRATADAIKEHIESGKDFLDVGKGNNLHMGVATSKFDTAVAMLKDEGFTVHNIKVPQVGTGEMTNFKVLTKDTVPWKDAREAVFAGQVKTIAAQSDDGGLSFIKPPKAKPVSVDLDRVVVNWDEDGGTQMDGVIEIRRGAEGLDLGASKYAQVRVAVNGTHYLKGMAIYADDLPAGTDIRFNTNKSKSDPNINGDKLGAMKEMKKGDNPFGATTYQKMYVDKDGKTKVSALNIVNEEGSWDKWSRNLSSQMLSKQSLALASTQLSKARKAREDEFKEIMSLTNPMVREKLLKEFAESSDAAAVHLKAAAMDRQATKVLLPMNSMRRHEIYAPGYNDGEKLVLVRHPHGGPFEIPELTVNNRNAIAKRIMGGARDAVGIHSSVAEQLSGADFDGDTVVLIPNDARRVKTQSPLKDLQGFEPKIQYREVSGMTRMTKDATQSEMGKISNLITDMTIRSATESEIARAVKHSMVVIDAEKHKLNYKQSEIDNDIKSLKAKYQGGPTAGAATLVSRASATARVPQQKLRSFKTGGPPIDPKTGKLVYVPTGETRRRLVKTLPDGTKVYADEPKTTKGSRMEFVDDARRLLSGGSEKDSISSDRGQPIERVYADYANSMKDMANRARRELVAIQSPRQNKAAKAIYANEVKTLDDKLKIALRNAPLERRAQAVANALAKSRIDSDPSLDKDDVKKIRYQSLQDARDITGAKKVRIGTPDTLSAITAREWEAIQSGAVAATKVREILANADMERIKELAQPRPRTSLTAGQMARVRQMSASGKSPTEIASALGLPRSTVADNLDRM